LFDTGDKKRLYGTGDSYKLFDKHGLLQRVSRREIVKVVWDRGYIQTDWHKEFLPTLWDRGYIQTL